MSTAPLVAVNGTLMRGLKLNGNMGAVGATFVREARTAPVYRLWSVRDDHPGMVRVSDGSGTAVAVEVWQVPAEGIAELLLREPPGLSIGKVPLEDGSEVLGVLAEPALVENQREITALGGWRAYVEQEGDPVVTAFGVQVLPEVDFGSVSLWRQIARGFSQCAFQANELTGGLLILAVLVFKWHAAVGFVIAVVLGTLTAKALRGVPDLLDLGLYGFNSGLMALALLNFYNEDAALWIAVPILAVIVAAVAVLMSKVLPFPFLAAPFIATFWLLWMVEGALNLEKLNLGAFPDAPEAFGAATAASVGSTLFAGAVLPGLIALAAIAVSNWRHAVVALMGAVIAVALAIQVGAPGVATNVGFVGFNAVLAAIAVFALVQPDLRLAALAAMGSTWIFAYLNSSAPFPALASGFVLVVWLMMALEAINPWFNGEQEEAEATESVAA